MNKENVAEDVKNIAEEAEDTISLEDAFVKEETDGRVKVRKVEFSEHGKNSAIFTREQANI